MAFEALPLELRAYPQWILWRLVWDAQRAKYTKVPMSPHTGRNAATDQRGDWSDFDTALARLVQHYKPGVVDGLGFVFGYDSGVAGIDVDKVFDSNGTVLNHDAIKIADKFGSYTELSPSRTGLHTLIKANLPSGRRFGNVEIYGQGRYFTVTGNSYGAPRPLLHAQALADDLVASIDAHRQQAKPAAIEWGTAQKYDDRTVWDMASTAANGAKFSALWQGDTSIYNGDWSRADFALIDILAFYSDAPLQVERLFMQSGLAARTKAHKRREYVLDMIQRAYDRKHPILPQVATLQPPPPPAPQPAAQLPTTAANDDDTNLTAEEIAARADDPYTMPPGGGLVGDIAQFIYQQAPFPIKEAALAAALGLMAGVCGRQYQFGGKGLNLFLFLLAHTGAGKEQMAMGINKLMDAVCDPPRDLTRPPSTNAADIGFGAARHFVGPQKLTGKGAMIALTRSDTLSFISVMPEFAYTLERMKEGSRDVGAGTFREALLDLYMKSAEGNRYQGHVTADKETTIKPLVSPALSLLAESTPAKFYQFLDEDMVTSGLLPRCVLFESNTFEESINRAHATVKPSRELVAQLTALCMCVMQHKSTHDLRIQVGWAPGVEELSLAYQRLTRERMQRRSDAHDELWNRAHQNVERIAALVAIGQNHLTPVVTREVLEWSIRLLDKQTFHLIGKFKRGEVGQQLSSEDEQLKKLRHLVDRYKLMTPETMTPAQHKRFGTARGAGLIGFSYLMQHVAATACFKSDGRRDTSRMLHDCINVLQRSGELGARVPLQSNPGEYYQLV